MKTKLCLLLISLCSLITYGQGGNLDLNFGIAGKAAHFAGATPVKFVLQSDEKMVFVGHKINTTTIDFFAERYLQNGFIDSTFGTNGVSTVPTIGTNVVTVSAAAVQADNKIVIAGVAPGIDYKLLLTRLKADGTVDSTFAGTGRLNINLADSFISVSAVKILPGGEILVAGGSGSNTTLNFRPLLVKIKADGTLDNTYGVNGIKTIDDVGFPADITDFALQTDGKVVIVLNPYVNIAVNPFYVMRLDAAGVRDNSFGTNGMTTITFTNPAAPNALIVQNDNKILVTGTEELPSGQFTMALARFLTDGTPDNGFGVNGAVAVNYAYTLSFGSVFPAQQQDGKIVVIASSKSGLTQKFDFLLSRFREDGTADNEFGTAGYVLTDFGTNVDYSTNIFVLNNGMILAGGYTTTIPYQAGSILARYKYCGISITGQPEDISRKSGANVQFSMVSSSPTATYQWQVERTSGWENLTDGGQYSGTQTFTLNIANVTIANNFERYRGVAISGTCADTSLPAKLSVQSLNSIEELYALSGIRIYPNPALSSLYIDLKDKMQTGMTYAITDLPGRVIRSGQLKTIKNSIDISALGQGVYLLSLGQTGTIKFVKN